MQFFLSQQVTIFLFAIFAGVVIGIINEPFRFLRYSGFNSKSDIFIQDVVFMAISAFITYFFALCYNKGDVRFFVLIGELCGFLLFRYTIGLLTGKLFYILNYCIELMFSVVKKFINIIVTILTKARGFILVKIPLFKKTEKSSCHNSKNYCIITKSISFFKRVFIKR